MFYNFLQFFLNFPLKVLIFIIFFTIPLKRRNFFWLRAVTVGLIYIISFYFIPISGYIYNVVLFSLSMLWIISCFRSSWYFVVFSAVGAFAGQHISYYLFRILQIFTQIQTNSIQGMLISTGICIIVAFVCYFALVRKINYFADYKSKSILFNSAIILSLTIICGENIPQTNDTTNLLYCIYAVVSCGLALAVQYGIFHQNELQIKNQQIEQMMYAEKKQQQLSKQSIDMINIRCHDLKHQVELLQQADNVNRKGELIDELKKAISEYDAVIHTGFEALDTVLTEKNYACKQKNIIFSYIVDGEKLSFMSDIDVYSLFGNALDNAIEALSDVDKERRIISLFVVEKQGYAHIHIENYCDKQLKFIEGVPQTTKGSGLHGFGTKSITTISQKYNGVAKMSIDDSWFKLNIFLPIP